MPEQGHRDRPRLAYGDRPLGEILDERDRERRSATPDADNDGAEWSPGADELRELIERGETWFREHGPGPLPPASPMERLGARMLAEVSTAPPPDRLIDKLDPSGHSILYGTGGVGKGVLACQWIRELVAGGRRVLIADYENHPEEWARRVWGLGGPESLDEVILVTPLTAAWGGRRGALWEQAGELRSLALDIGADYIVVDSIVPACSGMDPLKPEAVSLYTGGLELIGIPTLSLAHVPKDGDLKYPFGSVFWHNLARVTYSLERTAGSTVITNRKANNYIRRGKHQVETSWEDGVPRSVWERPLQMVLSARITAVLGDGALTVDEITVALNDETDDDEEKGIKPGTVRTTLTRGARERPPQFTKDGSKWKRS